MLYLDVMLVQQRSTFCLEYIISLYKLLLTAQLEIAIHTVTGIISLYSQFQVACPIAEKQKSKLTNQMQAILKLRQL